MPKRDIKFSDDGDIDIIDGDMVLASSDETLKQQVLNRIKTNDPEWFFHPDIGSNLEDIRGKKNNQETGIMTHNKIEESLKYGSFFNNVGYNIEVFPTGINSLTAVIDIIRTNNNVRVEKEIEL